MTKNNEDRFCSLFKIFWKHVFYRNFPKIGDLWILFAILTLNVAIYIGKRKLFTSITSDCSSITSGGTGCEEGVVCDGAYFSESSISSLKFLLLVWVGRSSLFGLVLPPRPRRSPRPRPSVPCDPPRPRPRPRITIVQLWQKYFNE